MRYGLIKINWHVCYLRSPVGLGHLPRGRDGMCEDFSIIRNPGATNALCCLLVRKKQKTLFL